VSLRPPYKMQAHRTILGQHRTVTSISPSRARSLPYGEAVQSNLGLTNQLGEVASERTARETWYQARRHVASDRANSASLAATGIVRRHPTASVPSRSRASASWRPEQVQAQSIPNKAAVPNLGQTRPLQSGPHDPSLGTMPGVVGPVSDDVVEARLAAFRRELDERSGR